MTNTITEVADKQRVDLLNWHESWKWIVSSMILIIAIVLTGFFVHQSNRFNPHITINHIDVGGLTIEQALKKLDSTVLKNKVYIGQKQIMDGKDTKIQFTNSDLANIKKMQQEQWTFFPSSRAKNYLLMPVKDVHQREEMKDQLEKKIDNLNKKLKAPKDAYAHLVQGKMIVTKSVDGKQYDVASLLKQYLNQKYESEIHLNPVYKQPIRAASPIVKKQKEMLKVLVQRTVVYKVQDHVYSLKASDLIKNAHVSKDMKYIFDSGGITNKIAEINGKQSTINKNYPFKTHSGSMISVKGESYGWALDVAQESMRIKDAFEKGEKSLSASNVYGVGWNHHGIGYLTTTNNGIGDTYAEVSIKEQRIWLYKNGQLMVTTPVVTGWHGVNQDTPTGVWYIEYKQTPSILKGSEVGNLNYSVKVKYWAPFTLDGCGFHDASWRTNWSSTAYLTQGSGGCVNTPSSAMKSVFDNLSQNEPVVVY